LSGLRRCQGSGLHRWVLQVRRGSLSLLPRRLLCSRDLVRPRRS
jgi:hypothetical protein